MIYMHPDRASARRGVLLHLQPLSRRIPLMMTGVLAVVVVAMLWLGSNVVVRSVVDAELMRLQAASDQLRSVLASQTHRMQRDNIRIAALPELSRAVSGFASIGDRDAARRSLSTERARLPQVRSVALWSANGELI